MEAEVKYWLDEHKGPALDYFNRPYELYTWRVVADCYSLLESYNSRCQTLLKLAKKYLATPISSVYSERLFSEMGQVYEVRAEGGYFIRMNGLGKEFRLVYKLKFLQS